MKLIDFLNVANEDDMIEVYADDGATRPCELKLVDDFYVSEWVIESPVLLDELEDYMDREVTSVATVMLDKPGSDKVVAMRVYVKHKEGDKDVRDVEEAQYSGRAIGPESGVKHDGHGQVKTVIAMRLGPAVTNRNGDAFDLTEAIKSAIEARIKKGNLVPAIQGRWDMFRDGRLRFSVTNMDGFGHVYRVAIHVADGTLITADELQTTFGNIAMSLGFSRYIEDAWCDDHKVGYLGIVDGEIVCAMDFDFTEVE
jgi:hypothetical protein